MQVYICISASMVTQNRRAEIAINFLTIISQVVRNLGHSCNYKPVCLCKLRDAPTFKTEAFRLVSNVQLVKQLLLRNELTVNTALPCSSSTVTKDALRY